MAKVPKNPQAEAEAEAPSTGIAFELVIIEAIVGKHGIGDVISDADEIATVMQKYPGHFTKRAKSV